MSYCVDYDISGNVKIRRISNSKRKKIWAFACVILGAAFAVYASLNGWLRAIFLPGFDDTSAAAVSEMLNSIQEGESVGNAVTAFCREIIANAK